MGSLQSKEEALLDNPRVFSLLLTFGGHWLSLAVQSLLPAAPSAHHHSLISQEHPKGWLGVPDPSPNTN